MTHVGPLIISIVGSIVLATILGLIANRLKISPLVGYLLAGVIFGQLPTNYQADSELIQQLAEIGVILLMFGVGLHFSLADLLSVKNIAIPGALVQISVATLLGMGLSHFMGWSVFSGFVFGLCLSTASTVVLLRALEERQLIESHRGKIAIGWLIVEDLAMVIALVLLPALASTLVATNVDIFSLSIQIIKTLSLVVIFIAIMVIFGRKVIPSILKRSAGTGSEELFTLTVLAIALGIAFAALQLFGASLALGAFFAGVVLNDSEFSHRAARDTQPLRDAFSVLFFVSVGMLFKPDILLTNPLALLATVAIIIFGKSIAAYFIVRTFKHSKRTALTISASLAQIGEFAFILATLGMSEGARLNIEIISDEAHSLILGGAIISILLNPIIFSLIERYLDKTETIVEQMIDEVASMSSNVPDNIKEHTILIGYSRVTEIISQQLDIRSLPSIIVDDSLAVVEELQTNYRVALLSDPDTHEMLESAKIEHAKYLIISIANSYKAEEISQLAKKSNPQLEIYVHAHCDEILEHLEENDAVTVITGEEEIAARILSLLKLGEIIDEPQQEELPLEIPKYSDLPEGNGSPI